MENKKQPLTLIDLVETLLNEAKKKKEKSKSKSSGKEKMADKDYDGDGEVETSKEEYFGSKDKAIKKAMGKKEIVSKKKKKEMKEGTIISDGVLMYGGFPRKLSEANGVVDSFNDSNDSMEGNKKTVNNVATQTDAQEENLESIEARLEKMRSDYSEADYQLSDPEYRWSSSSAGRQAQQAILDLEKKRSEHPEFKKKVSERMAQIGGDFFSRKGPTPKAEPFESPEERGLRMGPKSLPPTDYDLGRSSRRDR